jgi:hypothetical protein
MGRLITLTLEALPVNEEKTSPYALQSRKNMKNK